MDMERESVHALQCAFNGQERESSDGEDFDHLMARRSARGRHCHHQVRVRLHHCFEGSRQQTSRLQHNGMAMGVGQLLPDGVCTSSPKIVLVTKSSVEEASSDEHATAQGRSVVEDKSRVKRCGNWSDASLRHAIDVITDCALKLKITSRIFEVPATSLHDHLYGKTRTKQRGNDLVLRLDEE